jgi:hypothetical protein
MWEAAPSRPDGEAVLATAAVRLTKGKAAQVTAETGAAGTVRGVVKDAVTGLPLAGEWVSLGPVGERQVIAASVKTEADGTFAIKAPVGKYEVWEYGWAPEGGNPISSAAVEVGAKGAATSGATLVVRQRPVYRGQLVDEGGDGVVGWVSVGYGVVETDAEGGFAVEDPGRQIGQTISVSAVDKTGKLGRGLMMREVSELQGKRIVMVPLGAVVGRVVDGAGTGLGEATVEMMIIEPATGSFSNSGGERWTTTVEKDGRFRIAPVPVGFTLELAAELRGEQVSRKVAGMKAGEERDLGKVVIGPQPGMRAPAGMQLPAVAPVGPVGTPGAAWDGEMAGRVVNEKGEPVAGVSVYFLNGISTMVEDTTDLKGKFYLKGVPKGEALRLRGRYGGRPLLEWSGKAGEMGLELKLLPQAGGLVGKPALGLMVDSWLTEGPHGWDELKGKVVLVETGVYSRTYQPATTRALYEKYKDKGLVVVTVLSRAYGTPPGELKAWAAEQQMTWAVGIDAEEAVAPAGVKKAGWGATEDLTEGAGEFLVDKAGVWRGAVDETEGLEAAVVRLLEE